jgi:beta-lactamase superfamily II metal-dependent hydrolase
MKLFCPMIVLLLLCTLSTQASVQRPAFTLWQLPEQTYSQMMSYVIRTPSGKIVVIDGGMPGDAPYLRGFLAALGNHVDVWFLSHPHDDHMGAITEILNKPGDLKIGRIYASMPDAKWIREVVTADEQDAIALFQKSLGAAGKTAIDLKLGQTMNIDGVKFEVLGVRNSEIHPNPLNNSSIVLRVSDSAKSILFLGDLGPEGGEKLLRGKYAGRLHADYVQMAHHGQNGVGLPVYEAIRPTYCLWPTPTWLWDNNINGKGKGTGPWKTLEVRQWMEDLHVKHSYVSEDGLVRID